MDDPRTFAWNPDKNLQLIPGKWHFVRAHRGPGSRLETWQCWPTRTRNGILRPDDFPAEPPPPTRRHFDAASHEKWLLHTWSLAVEWQFYLLLPLALLAVWKLRPGRRTVVWVMAAGLLASLALSVVLTPLRPTAAFYLLPTRAWEMLGGGLVFLLPPRRVFPAHQRAALEAVGLLLVMGAIIGFDAASAWPGWRRWCGSPARWCAVPLV